MINYITKPFIWFFKLEAASGLVLLFSAIISCSRVKTNNSVPPVLMSITSGQKPHSRSTFDADIGRILNILEKLERKIDRFFEKEIESK